MTSVLLALTLLTCGSGQSSFSPDQIPKGLVRRGAMDVMKKGFQAGRPEIHAVDQKLVFLWRASPSIHDSPSADPVWDIGKNAVDDARWKVGTQEFSVRYYPTAFAPIDSAHALVGGIKKEDGSTLLELWSFAWPEAMPAPVTSAQTGLSVVHVVNPDLQSVSRIYEADVPGKRFVLNLTRLRVAEGPSTHALVQFNDSNDVYGLELASGTLTLVASSAGAGILGPVPSLASPTQEWVTFGDRIGVGYSYRFLRSFPSTNPLLILLDTDRNGSIDSFLELSDGEYEAGGWRELTSYENWWTY